ncbi:hypothetical protein [Azospirillum sp. sgz302134]
MTDVISKAYLRGDSAAAALIRVGQRHAAHGDRAFQAADARTPNGRAERDAMERGWLDYAYGGYMRVTDAGRAALAKATTASTGA